MLTGRVQITQHAADRYVKRVDGSLTLHQAKQLLETIALTAAPLREKTIMGQEQWKIEHPFPCVLVVKRDPGAGSLPIVVTVFEAAPGNAQDDAIERLVALQASRSRAKKPRRARHFR